MTRPQTFVKVTLLLLHDPLQYITFAPTIATRPAPQHVPSHTSHKVRFEGATSTLQPMHLLTICAIAVVVLAIACIMYSFIITAIDKATHAKLHAPTTDRRYKRRKCKGFRRRCLEPSRILLFLLTESYIIAEDVKYTYAD